MSDRPPPAQVRGARGLLDWSLLDLARAADVPVSAVERFDDGAPAADGGVDGAIRDALETEGVESLSDGRRIGASLRRS